jgi:Xaa-Pro aminopeptidase
MSELAFSAEIEREARRSGHLGVFRAFGRRMEIFMGSILSGDNAGAVSPFDFALGGRGQHPSVPVGMTGGPLRAGTTVMVDVSGNWEGYLTDQTRVFRIGEIPEEAYRAHKVAMAIQEEIARHGLPGTSCGALYDIAVSMAAAAGLGDRFMGSGRQARFVGHGTGIEINEPPVLAAGSRAALQEGNVIALEPKFVIPGVGAVGIENTWLVTETGMEKLTTAPEEILPLG